MTTLTPEEQTALNNLGGGWPSSPAFGDLLADQILPGTAPATRAVLTGVDIDWGESFILTKTLTENTVLTASNLELDKVLLLIIDGNFTLTLPAGTTVVGGGAYDGAVTNYIYIHCVDTGAPEFIATISQP